MLAPLPPVRAGRVARIAIGLVLVANTARILSDEQAQGGLAWYGGLTAAFLVLFTSLMWRPARSPRIRHAYLGIQSGLIILMLARNPEVDTIAAFFVPLAFQAPLLFSGRTLWTWVAVFAALTGSSLVLGLGLLQGLALALPPIAVILVVPAFMLVNHETETARARSQTLLRDLEHKHAEIQARAGNVQELSALQERNRLARELHDRVSQLIFGIALTSRSARLLIQKDPGRVRDEVVRLQEMTAGALRQLRVLISEMRP